MRRLARDIDVLYLHRHCDRPVQQLARQAKEHGTAVVWDNDDDVSPVPAKATVRKHTSSVAWERKLADMRTVFDLADLVTLPSRTLSARHSELAAARTAAVKNYGLDQFLVAGRRAPDTVTIGWVAGLEHAMDAERIPAGAPWPASPVGPYEGLGEKQGGRLVADGDWHEALTRLVDRPRERRKLAKRATRWAARETLSKNVTAWEAMLSEAAERARA